MKKKYMFQYSENDVIGIIEFPFGWLRQRKECSSWMESEKWPDDIKNFYDAKILHEFYDKLMDSKVLAKQFRLERYGKDIVATIFTKNHILVGKATKHDDDRDKNLVGSAIAICRALGWKDIENIILERLMIK